MKEITIKTKFNLGEVAYVYNSENCRLVEIHITQISFSTDGVSSIIMYHDGQGHCYEESKVYKTKQEFIDKL